MAQRTHVLLIDDLDGSSADETVSFGLDGSAYEIDLSTQNAAQLRESLADYVAHSRRGVLGRSGGKVRGTARAGADVDTADVRAWARSNGYDVNERGRISAVLLEAYRAAH